MSADTRLFRVTRTLRWPRFSGRVVRTTFEYGNRISTSQRCASYSYRTGAVTKVEATNADATEGWKDVSDEFLQGVSGQ